MFDVLFNYKRPHYDQNGTRLRRVNNVPPFFFISVNTVPTFTREASVVKLVSHLPSNPGVMSSIPGFSSLSDETLNRGPVTV